MATEHETKRQALLTELDELTERRDAFLQHFSKLGDLGTTVDDVERLRTEIEQKRLDAIRQQKEQADQIEESGFEKEKEPKRIRHEHELVLAELNATHRKMMLDVKIDAADGLLKQLGYTRVDPAELEQLKKQASQHVTRSEQEIAAIRTTAVDEFKKRFSISASEPMDVTELFYREKTLQEENQAQAQQIAKLETEVARMRTHIENESARAAKAIEAARTNIQNIIEPDVKR